MTEAKNNNIPEKFVATIRPHLRFLRPEDPLNPDEELGKLGLDSMAAINLLLDLEQSFQIQIPDSALTADSFKTATTLWQTIRGQIS